MISGCIKGNDEGPVAVADIAECMRKCKEATGFVCRSIDFRISAKECRLNAVNAASAGSNYTVPCYADPSNMLYRYCRWLYTIP